MSLNREFIVVFQPKDKEQYDGRRRFAIGANSLSNYVGDHNAKSSIDRALNSLDDKCRVKLRKHGIIDFYFR